MTAPAEAGADDASTAKAARALAQLWLESETSPKEPGAVALAVAWALKDICYETVNSDPARSARAAVVLRNLSYAGVPAEQQLEIAALSDWTAGVVCNVRGQMSDALRLLDAASDGMRKAGNADAAAQTQVPKIRTLSMLGRHDEAARCALAAKEELLRLGNLSAAARVSQNLGSLESRRDNYPAAAGHFREAAVLFARLREHEWSVLADIGLADTHTAMGNFEEAMRIFARARMRAENQGLGLRIALVDESVALLELARGHYPPALAGLEAARRAYEALALPQHLAIAEKQLADIYLELRLLPEARALLDSAVDKFAAQNLPDEHAWALTQRGRALARLGQSPDASFASASLLFTQQGNAVGAASVALARAELALQNPGDDGTAALVWADAAASGYGTSSHAEGHARAQVIRAQALLRQGHTSHARMSFADTLARAQTQQQLQVQVRCLSGLGQCALAEDDAKAAAEAFEAAIELFEDQRRALPGDELRSAFLTDHLRPYEALLQMAVEAGDARAALMQLERFRARTLDERVDERSHVENAGPTTSLNGEDNQHARERLNWLYRHLQRQQEEGGESAMLVDEMRRLERELMEHARRQRLAAPRAQLGLSGQLEVEALQAALQPGDALVEYGVVGEELFACVVRREEVILHRHLSPWREVVEAVRAMRFQMETLCHGATPVHKHMAMLTARANARLLTLHEQIWAPLEAHLSHVSRVLVVPHGPLNAVPFVAVCRAAGGRQLQWAVAPSARAALRGLHFPPKRPHQLLALADSQRLPHTQQEVEAVMALFVGSGGAGEVHVAQAATIAHLRAGSGQSDVVHLACHAQFRSDNPRFSALHLADGVLTVEQAESLDFKQGSVVLSACETGMAELASGDEQIGLVRAFLVAGAARVVASLWPVDDEVTSLFMKGFYEALLKGQSHAASLKSAQVSLRAVHPHPFYWAAFGLHGGW